MEKVISIIIPTYNEELNVEDIYLRIKSIFTDYLQKYQYEIIFADNASIDQTRIIIEKICSLDKGVKAIFNANNFGFSRSIYHALLQGSGDCTVLIFADMQDPPELLIQFVEEWEKGSKVIVGIKNRSKENPIKYAIRQKYYELMRKISETGHIDQFTGFGLYDRSFVEVLRQVNDPIPYLRGIVAEYAGRITRVYYEQKKREKGKSSFNFSRNYSIAMLGITSSSNVILRIATITGFFTAIVSLIIAIITFIIKLVNWNTFQVGIAAISIGTFFFGSALLFFVGFIGEYIANINTRVMHHPIVIEEKRINFTDDNESMK